MDDESYVLLEAVEHVLTSVQVSYSGQEVRSETRYVARLHVVRGGHEALEDDQHRQPGIGQPLIHPHKTPAEAIACGRVVAAAKYPGLELREAG